MPTKIQLLRALAVALAAAALVACGGASGDAPGHERKGPAAAGQKAAAGKKQGGPGGRPGAGRRGGPGRPSRDAIAVRVAPAIQESLSALYSTSATLRPDKHATVTARTRGVIERLAVEEGDIVSEGQALAFLEDDEQTIEAAIARTGLDNLEREYGRAQRLFDQGLLAEEEYETARRSVEEARHTAERAELTLSRTVIRAPFAGRVLTRHLDPGGTVSDGTAIYDLADLDPLFADVNVPERHVGRLNPGQLVRLAPESSDDVVDAAIERIAPSVDPSTGTVKVTVAVAGSAVLRPGTFVKVDIVTDTHAEALVVPRSALVAEGRRWHLFRLEDGGESVRMLEVTTGYEEGDRVEILEVVGVGDRLDPGALVVVVGAAALEDGAPVQVVEPEEKSPDPAGEA